MANYVVHFEHSKNADVNAQITVPYAIDPAVAADDYEIIVDLAYGLFGEVGDALAAIDIEVRDMVAVKIMHNDDLIIDFRS